jgi:hypothetical protein
MSPEDKLTTALTIVMVLAAISAQRAARGVGVAKPEAAAYHAAAGLYRNLSLFFGQRALLAEAAYWKAVV